MTRSFNIHSAAVLGAGTMGAQIAAHLANAGVPVRLLDVSGDAARRGLARAAALKPPPFFTRRAADLVTPSGFDEGLPALAGADWIIEAIVEDLAVKRDLLARVDAVRRADAIVSSNTSGIPLASIAAGRSEGFQQHWLGTHFFNPPRFLHLLEIIPTPATDPAVVEHISRFADHRLGKGVVVSRDTPGFIANRIGMFGVVRTLRALDSGEFSVEEIDAISGPLIGRPRSATFRTIDIAGLDILAHVAQTLDRSLEEEHARGAFVLPPFVQTLIERGWTGAKAGQGFYARGPAASGGTRAIMPLDPRAMSYREAIPVRLPEIDAARRLESLGERLAMLVRDPGKSGAFLRATLVPTLLYAAAVAPLVARSIDDVDRAMAWGFGWELGPFEIWDAIGVRAVVELAGDEPIPPLVADLLASGRDRFRDAPLPPAASDLLILKTAKERQRVVRHNPGASLVDLGDGVLAVEFHSKLNTIGGDTVQMLQAGLAEASANFSALVIGNEAPDFSAGANLMLLLLEAQEGNWDEIDLMVRTFQRTTGSLRYADVPVVVCPAGLTLGGGCEILLHGDRVQAAADSYIGLVEVGVGLIPAGGGTKEMLARAVEPLGAGADFVPPVRAAFEAIGFATVSTSAAHAAELGYLRGADGVTMNRERLIADAKAVALARAQSGYRPPAPRMIRVGGESLYAALALGLHLAWRGGAVTDHDLVIGRALARVLAGGSFAHPTEVPESYLLDLEREAFLRLCGEPKTRERMQHMLKTGKPLRN